MNGKTSAAELDVQALLAKAVAGLAGKPRAGQQEMAQAVSECFAKDRHLLVQAGTGTGKSLGYLVPAIKQALRTDRPVVVATSTIALQSQVINKDLPNLLDAIQDDLPRPVTYALLKGRSQFICLHKVEGGYPEEIPLDVLERQEAQESAEDTVAEGIGAQVVRLREWARATDTGDRDHLETPVTDRAWRQVSVSGKQCLGQKCPFNEECFSERNREISRDVDIVVTNHAMLATDIASDLGIIPEYSALIVDEAHDLVSRFTTAATLALHPGMLNSAARAVREMGLVAKELEAAHQAVVTAAGDLDIGRLPEELPAVLREALILGNSAARLALSELRDVEDKHLQNGAAAKANARAILNDIADITEQLLAGSPDQVSWINETATGRVFYVAPLDVAQLIRGKILPRSPVVFTSATLSLGDKFTAAARSFGLAKRSLIDVRAPEVTATAQTAEQYWSGIDVGSPFNYRKQGILYVAADLPMPGRDGPTPEMLERVLELVESSDGGALGLFSSRRAAEAAAAYVRERSALPVLLQGEDSVRRLVEEFRADAQVSLFGTLSLWQGVDAPGLTCRLVLVDRIPFPRPDDPVISARQEQVQQQGFNGFYQVSVVHAATLLAQGAGRLIRTSYDRGVVALLDSRLTTARYGKSILQALPNFWYSTNAEVVTAALSRLAAASNGEQ